MQRQHIQSFLKHSIWISLLLHILFMLSFTLVWSHAEEEKHELPSYLPSYVAPSQPQQQSAAAVPQQEQVPTLVQPQEVKPDGLLKSKPKQIQKQQASKMSKPSKRVTFSREDQPINISRREDADPIHLIGETKIIKPLVKILANALHKHLFYPRTAADFNLRGVVLVGFVLHPEGFVTEAKVVKSSGAGVLDDAARSAVGSMSPLPNVSEYIQGPEFLVVGIIFG